MKLLPMRHTPQSCHWSVPTLFMPHPYWLSAWDSSWHCWNDRAIWILDSTDVCVTCPLWRPREVGHGQAADAVPPKGAVPLSSNVEAAPPASVSPSYGAQDAV